MSASETRGPRDVDRAEQASSANERAERFLHQMTDFVERAAARTREEAEDRRAEAQEVRRGQSTGRTEA